MRALYSALLLAAACTVVPAQPTTPSSSEPGPPPGDAPAATEPAPAGSVARPGGDFGLDARTCDAAHDHCFRDGTWLALQQAGDDRVHPVFLVGDRWFDWESLGELTVVEAYRTRAATAADLQPGAIVVFYKGRHMPGDLPGTESQAYVDWRIDTIATVDAAADTFEWGSGSVEMPIGNARVIVETR